MTADLDRLAASVGLVRSYRGLDGTVVTAPDDALLELIKAAGADPSAPGAISTQLEVGTAPRAPDDIACYLPEFLEHGRAWGVTCQLYGLSSRRNWGIGDFEDLARLGEIVAGLGADFIGVNPLHALFLAEPQLASPFYPAHRDYLNPLYIAVDKVNGFDPAADADETALARLRQGELVDYAAVARCKLDALRQIYRRSCLTSHDDLDRFVADGGTPLRQFALFQAISLDMKSQGFGAGWHSWPDGLRAPGNGDLYRLEDDYAEEVSFQSWLQWLADHQLRLADERLRRAGMRIGLYLDLAVGTAPDGAATWADRSLTVVGAEIGAPPDMFNPKGQKWGLAPMSPAEIAARDFKPIRNSFDAILRHAGALRIDHAMSLYRLFWIPWGYPAGDGAYALYPMTDIVRQLAAASRHRRAIIIGEDLGVVPEGFQHEMERASMLGYRLFYFQRDGADFIPPDRWPRNALACVGSHDTATLAGWWTGYDIELRRQIGLCDDAGAEGEARGREKGQAIAALRARGCQEAGEQFSEAVAVGIHRLVAATPCRLAAAQLEDLLGLTHQANVPGTVHEHPNWCRRLPVPLEALADVAMLRAVLGAMAQERPRLS